MSDDVSIERGTTTIDDESRRRELLDALDVARSGLDYLRVYVVEAGTFRMVRVRRAYDLVAEAIALLDENAEFATGARG